MTPPAQLHAGMHTHHTYTHHPTSSRGSCFRHCSPHRTSIHVHSTIHPIPVTPAGSCWCPMIPVDVHSAHLSTCTYIHHTPTHTQHPHAHPHATPTAHPHQGKPVSVRCSLHLMPTHAIITLLRLPHTLTCAPYIYLHTRTTHQLYPPTPPTGGSYC